jgi:hypothetical protein
MKPAVLWLKELMQYLGGEQDAPPPGMGITPRSALWGAWWVVLLGIVILFCGQSSKFIYIDF